MVSPHQLTRFFAFSLLLVTITMTADPTPPSSPVAPTVLGTLPGDLDPTSNTARFIGSPRPESLQVVANLGTGTTTLTLNFLNRSASGNVSTYTIANKAGLWGFVGGTLNSLSCSLIVDSTGKYDLVRFDSASGVFQTLNISSAIGSILGGQTINIATDAYVGEKCMQGLLFNNIYRIGNSSFNAISIPSSIIKEAISPSFNYAIGNFTLFKFRPDSMDYTIVRTFDNYAHFEIQEYQNRLLVVGRNFTTNAGNSQLKDLKQTIYVLQENGTSLTQLNTVVTNVAGIDPIQINVKASPLLTKFGFVYSMGGIPTLVARSVNYQTGVVETASISAIDAAAFLMVLSGAGPTEFILGDYFMFVRNSYGYSLNNSIIPVELTYQFIGASIINIRSRALTGAKDLTQWRRGIIDGSFSSQLVMMAFYQTNPSSPNLEVNQFRFGSSSSNLKPVVIQTYFFSFTEPTATPTPIKVSYPDQFLWSYFTQTTGPNSTAVKNIRLNSSLPNNIYTQDLTISGTATLIAQSRNCKLIKNSDVPTFKLYQFQPNLQQYVSVADITSQATSSSSSTVWRFSDRCEIFTIDNSVFVGTRANTGQLSYANPINNIIWKDFAWNLTFAVSGNDIRVFNPMTKSFDIAYTQTTNFLMTAKIYSAPGKIVVVSWDTNGSNFLLKINAYSTNPQNITKIFEWQKNDYVTIKPKVSVSENLTKIFIVGENNVSPTNSTVVANFTGFFLNYMNATKARFGLPMNFNRKASITLVKLNEQFLYYRQLPDTSPGPNPDFEAVIFLAQDSMPQVVYQRPLSSAEVAAWTKTIVGKNIRGNLEVLTESFQSGKVIVRQRELPPSNRDSSSSDGTSTIIKDGVVGRCPPGCTSCTSTTSCSGCNTGFVLMASTSTCTVCGPRCTVCSADDPNICTACRNGAFLSGSSCSACNSNCTACTVSAGSCSTCLPAQYFDGTSCKPCFNFCLACSSASVCTQCAKGFVVNPSDSSKCRRCATTCSSCLPTNITSCTSCEAGLELLNGVCAKCPMNCASCLNGICTLCNTNFAVSSNGSCIKACNLPCATCVEDQPSNCLSCYSGDLLSSSTCMPDLSCNANNSCLSCGIGYWLVISKCYPCSTIANCVNCDPSNGQICATCAKGYYVNNSACAVCPSQCSLCVDANICTACVDGFYLPVGQSESQCLACSSPCVTCHGASNLCTSCSSNFTLDKFRCQNNIFVGYKITLNVNPDVLLNNIDTFYTVLLNVIGESSNLNAVTITSIVAGSAVVSGGVTPTDTSSTASTSSTLSSSLSSGFSFGSGISILDASYQTYGVDSTPNQEEKNLGLIIGLSVGIPLFVIAVVVVSVYIYKKRASVKNDVNDANAENVVQEKDEIQREAVSVSDSIDLQNHSKVVETNELLIAPKVQHQQNNTENQLLEK